MDLLTYLRLYEPENLVKVHGNVYCTREHDSLKISNGKWMWWSRNIGGASALDYLIKVKGISFTEAMGILSSEKGIIPSFFNARNTPVKVKKLLLPEKINKDEITSIANNSRNKILSGLLRNVLEPNLGLTGTGQEVSIMRSTLVRKEVLLDDQEGTRINLAPSDKLMKGVLDAIVSFVMDAKKKGTASFDQLYNVLTAPEYHIGIRSGVIPIYIAAVFHEFSEDIILQNDLGQLPLSADTLQMINACPEDYTLVFLEWNPEKQEFVSKLSEIFSNYVIEAEKNLSAYDFVASAMKRWYLSLPRYAKESKGIGDKESSKRYLKMVKLLKLNLNGHELLFEKLPEAFGYRDFNEGLAENIENAKNYYDGKIAELKVELIKQTKQIFSIAANRAKLKRTSLSSVIKDWCETLNPHVFEQLFENGTNKCLGLFKEVTNDEETFVARLAKAATDLRVEDWDDDTVERFKENLAMYKRTAEEFQSSESESEDSAASTYEIRFRSDDGSSEVKRFDRVETSKRGKLLYNSILSEIDSMGYSISEQEKRQILMDILKKMC